PSNRDSTPMQMRDRCETEGRRDTSLSLPSRDALREPPAQGGFAPLQLLALALADQADGLSGNVHAGGGGAGSHARDGAAVMAAGAREVGPGAAPRDAGLLAPHAEALNAAQLLE